MPSCKMPFFRVAVGTNIERVVVTTISTKIIIKVLQILVFCYSRMNYPRPITQHQPQQCRP
jgi:hypothetical protein